MMDKIRASVKAKNFVIKGLKKCRLKKMIERDLERHAG